MAMTTNSSIKVKPFPLPMTFCPSLSKRDNEFRWYASLPLL